MSKKIPSIISASVQTPRSVSNILEMYLERGMFEVKASVLELYFQPQIFNKNQVENIFRNNDLFFNNPITLVSDNF